MNKIKTFIHEKLDCLSMDERIVLGVSCSIFLPFYCTIVAILAALVYLVKKGRIKEIIQKVPKSNYAIIFCFLTTMMALLYKNWLGAACGIGIFLLILFVLYFRTVINKNLFELILTFCCILSLGCVVIGLIEYIHITNKLGYSFWNFYVEDSPKYRINSFFFNANYYAMMIEFVVLICMYKLMSIRNIKIVCFYGFTILMNLFALYLTGCRTAWVPFIITVPFMFFMNHCYKYFTFSVASVGGALGILLLKPELFQRVTLLQDFMKRSNIWITAVKGIKAHPLLGEGPLTYNHIYKMYNGHATQHAHSVYLDPILSHGIIGVLIFGVYIGSNLKEVYKIIKNKMDIKLGSLIACFILCVLIHGLLDYTVYWIQTGLLFLLVLSSSSIYFNKDYK